MNVKINALGYLVNFASGAAMTGRKDARFIINEIKKWDYRLAIDDNAVKFGIVDSEGGLL